MQRGLVKVWSRCTISHASVAAHKTRNRYTLFLLFDLIAKEIFLIDNHWFSLQVAASSNGGGLSLRLPLKGIKTSLVHLEVKADNVTLVVNRAPAKIMSSEVCTYDGLICGGFQAIATRGFLYVAVSNIGAVPAEFRASVTNCTQGVLPIQVCSIVFSVLPMI